MVVMTSPPAVVSGVAVRANSCSCEWKTGLWDDKVYNLYTRLTDEIVQLATD